LPVVTVVGLLGPGLIGFTAVIESVFAMPGIGRLVVEAALNRDYPTIMTLNLLTAVAMLASTLAVDVPLLVPVLAPYDPTEQRAGAVAAPPSAAHPMGTDNFGGRRWIATEPPPARILIACHARPRSRATYADYLALEALGKDKHEFLGGEIFAMADGTPEHGAVAIAVGGGLRVGLRGRPCRVYSSDARVLIQDTGLTTYPDVSVVCGQLETAPEDPDAITNPVLLVEVLSETGTESSAGDSRPAMGRVGTSGCSTASSVSSSTPSPAAPPLVPMTGRSRRGSWWPRCHSRRRLCGRPFSIWPPGLGHAQAVRIQAVVQPHVHRGGQPHRLVGLGEPVRHRPGAVVLMVENYRTGLIWDVMRRCPYIVAGLRRAGFTGGWLSRSNPPRSAPCSLFPPTRGASGCGSSARRKDRRRPPRRV
jgi:hypothetical protein